MTWGLTTFKDIAEFISYIVTSMSLAAIYFSYFHSKKQIHFAAIEKCIRDYRELYNKYDEKYENPQFLDEYLDLVNEELFYMESGYLPKKVAEEWVDGMIDYLPFIYKNTFIFSKKFSQLNTKENTQRELFSYPRIYNFIKVNEKIDFEMIFLPLNENDNLELRNDERKILIKILLKNLKNTKKK